MPPTTITASAPHMYNSTVLLKHYMTDAMMVSGSHICVALKRSRFSKQKSN